jgi:diadenosine tetraphosphate (Ap4A) HIT family hydrolase
MKPSDTGKVMPTQVMYIEDSQAPWDDMVEEDYHVKVFADKYPVTEGHMLFVPKYNTVSVLMDCFEQAVNDGIKRVHEGEWDGFNVGFNYGPAAGQTVEWPHVHLIPRRKGDMEDPTGGVRHVIPEKGNYRKAKYNASKSTRRR